MDLIVTGFFAFIAIDGIVDAGKGHQRQPVEPKLEPKLEPDSNDFIQHDFSRDEFNRALDSLQSGTATTPVGAFVDFGQGVQFEQHCLGAPIDWVDATANNDGQRKSQRIADRSSSVIGHKGFLLISRDCAGSEMKPKVVIKIGKDYYLVKKVVYSPWFASRKKNVEAVVLEIRQNGPIQVPSDITAWNNDDNYKTLFGVHSIISKVEK